MIPGCGDAVNTDLRFLFARMSRLVALFAEITILFMEVVVMTLNLMIIGAMVMLIIVGGLWVELLNRIGEKRKKKITMEIWGRM